MNETLLKIVCPPAKNDEMAPYKLFNFTMIMGISVIGLIGNLLVILTFQRQKRKTSATTFLKNLAIFDMHLIVATNLFAHRYAYTLVFPESWVNHFTAGKLTIGILPISYICQSFTTWTVVAVALDRYIHVCHPLKAMKWCRIRIANRIVSGIVISSIVYNIPRFFEYYKILQVAKDCIDPCTGYFLTPKHSLGGNIIYKYTYAFGLYMGIMYAVPLGSLLFFNGKLINRLNAMNVPGAANKVVKLKGSDKILPSLIGVVTIFLICQIPDMILQILWRINSPFASKFSIIAYDLVIINSSINFVVYVIAADGFRRSLTKHVLPCIKITYFSDETTSNTGMKVPKTKSSVTHNSSDRSETELERNWEQSYTNPQPIEDSEESSQRQKANDDEPIQTPALVWIGGDRKPGRDTVESHVECEPANVVLPNGADLGVTGVYTVMNDPLIQQRKAQSNYGTYIYETFKTEL